MLLGDQLNIKEKDLVSLVGAGGKTSVMFRIAKEFKEKNFKVLITTTTRIFYPKEDYIDNIVLLDKKRLDINSIKKGSITVIGKSLMEENKLKGLDKRNIDNLYIKNIFDIILVESDGAKRKAIKAPNFNEPVISELTTKVVGIIGLDALYLKANSSNVHRIDEFLKVTESKKDEKINEKAILKLVLSPIGLFKNTPQAAEKTLILNKADDKTLKKNGYELGKNILITNINLNIIITSIKNNYYNRCKL